MRVSSPEWISSLFPASAVVPEEAAARQAFRGSADYPWALSQPLPPSSNVDATQRLDRVPSASVPVQGVPHYRGQRPWRTRSPPRAGRGTDFRVDRALAYSDQSGAA